MATNQESLPTLLFPSISPSWCPKGDIPTIFTSWQTIYGPQIVVNIPGLADVTPATIAEIKAEIVVLQNQVAALDKATQSGVTVVGTLNGVTTVIFGAAMPTNDYTVVMSMIDAGTAISTNPPSVSIVPGSLTTTQFQFRSNNAPTTWSVMWSVREN